MKHPAILLLGILALVVADGLVQWQIRDLQTEIIQLNDALHSQRLGASIPGFTPQGYAITNPTALKKLATDLHHVINDDKIDIFCANCGPLAEQLANLTGSHVVDVPYANPGLWVSPASDPRSAIITKILSDALNGRSVKIDTLPNDTQFNITSGKRLSIVVSKETHP